MRLCSGARSEMLGGGGAWCHPVARRGPIKPWENYVTFCWACPFRSIEVQWIESCREVIPPPNCLCVYVWEKSRGEVKGRQQAGKCIVNMLMLLTVSSPIKMSWSSTSKTLALGPWHCSLFSRGADLVTSKSESYDTLKTCQKLE